MKATGIVRNMDHLGRVVIPSEIRRTLKISTGDPVEFYIDGDKLIICKYDAIGDMEQLLDGVKRSIELADPMIPGGKVRMLIDKVDEMKKILAEDTNG